MFLFFKLEVAHRHEEEALLTADAYRVAFEQQLDKNSTLIYELLDKSSWRKKLGFGERAKKIVKQENGMKGEEEDLVHQIKAHKDEIVEKLLSMVCVYDKQIFLTLFSFTVFN